MWCACVCACVCARARVSASVRVCAKDRKAAERCRQKGGRETSINPIRWCHLELLNSVNIPEELWLLFPSARSLPLLLSQLFHISITRPAPMCFVFWGPLWHLYTLQVFFFFPGCFFFFSFLSLFLSFLDFGCSGISLFSTCCMAWQCQGELSEGDKYFEEIYHKATLLDTLPAPGSW